MTALEERLRLHYDAVNAAMACGEEEEIGRLLRPYMTEDAVLHPSATLLDAQTAVGLPAIARWLATMSFAEVMWRPETFEAVDGDTARVTGTVTAAGQASGAEGIARFEHRITLRDGLVSEVVASIPTNLG